MTETEKLGWQIAHAREAAGMTQAQLAARVGVTTSAVEKWERGVTRPRARTLAALRLAVNLPGDEQETREEWPTRVRNVTTPLLGLLASLPPDELRRWRHEIIVGLFHPLPNDGAAPPDAPDDAEVIVDLIGSYLTAQMPANGDLEAAVE